MKNHPFPQYQQSFVEGTAVFADRSTIAAPTPAWNPFPHKRQQHHVTHARHERQQPKPNYVLLGRGLRNVKHPGNIIFNKLVENFTPEYSTCTRSRKREIVTEIIAKLEQNGGGFRQYDTDSGQYLALDEEEARQKVMHAIQHRIRLLKRNETAECSKDSVQTRREKEEVRDKVPRSALTAAQHFASAPRHPISPQKKRASVDLAVPPLHYTDTAPAKKARFVAKPSSPQQHLRVLQPNDDALYERIGDSMLQTCLDQRNWQSSALRKDDTSFDEDTIEDIARRALEDARKVRHNINNNNNRVRTPSSPPSPAKHWEARNSSLVFATTATTTHHSHQVLNLKNT